ncbi:MAG: HisA/HisF-related TIM barrel protein, partial [Oscillospiraceae bacterium]
TWIHMVDLDGARTAAPKNSAIFIEVANKTDLKVEVGGGIRDMKTVEYYLSNGISRVILGSAALSNPQFVDAACKLYGDKIAVGIDAKNRLVSADGWLNDSTVDFITLAKKVEAFGAKYIIFTDISKDGTLSGPNLEQLCEINNAVCSNIIASGGIRNCQDIIDLKKSGLYGAICGKSLYSKSLNLKEAIKVC